MKYQWRKLLLILVSSAGILYFMTEVGALENTFWYWVNPFSWFPEWVLVNGFTYLALICGLSLIFPRYSISIALLAVVFGVLAVVNHFMFRMHSSLFALVDFKNIGTAVNVIGSYHFSIDKYIVLVAVLVVILLGISSYLVRHKELDRTHQAGRIILNAVLCAVPVYIIYFSPLSLMADKTGMEGWQIDHLYAERGYLPVIIENARKGVGSVIRPDWYDQLVLTELSPVDNAESLHTQEYPDILIIQAAGVSTPEDVYRIIHEGADGTGGTSGIVKAPDQEALIREMVTQIKKAYEER